MRTKTDHHYQVREHFKQHDPRLYPIVKSLDFDLWFEPNTHKLTKNYFVALSREIIGQQLSGKAADTIYERFTKLLKTQTYTPKQVLTLTDEHMRQVGMSWAKVTFVKNVAQAFESGVIDATRLHSWDDETIIDHLTAIKGVGRWTAEMFLIFTLGREDVFSFGDLGLKRGLEKVYGLKESKRVVVESIIAKWTPYKSYGSIALWHSLENS